MRDFAGWKGVSESGDDAPWMQRQQQQQQLVQATADELMIIRQDAAWRSTLRGAESGVRGRQIVWRTMLPRCTQRVPPSSSRPSVRRVDDWQRSNTYSEWRIRSSDSRAAASCQLLQLFNTADPRLGQKATSRYDEDDLTYSTYSGLLNQSAIIENDLSKQRYIVSSFIDYLYRLPVMY